MKVKHRGAEITEKNLRKWNWSHEPSQSVYCGFSFVSGHDFRGFLQSLLVAVRVVRAFRPALSVAYEKGL